MTSTAGDVDAIVVGAGPNGLVGANVLAERGWSVLVLEAGPTPGGAARTAELIEPGFRNDVGSAFYPLTVVSPPVVRMNLHEHGLEWLHAPIVVANPGPDGLCPLIARDLDETCDALDKTHPGDGDNWRRFYGRWQAVGRQVLEAMLTPFPPVKAIAKLAMRLPPSEYGRFARFAVLPSRRMGEECFDGEPARRLLAGTALHADLAPELNLAGFFGWILCCLAQDVGFPVPRGGAQAISDALVSRLRSLGGDVRCGAPVDTVVVEDGRATGVRLRDGEQVAARRAVLADVSAPMLYRHLVDRRHLPPRLLEDIEHFMWDASNVKVDWNLNGPIPWSTPDARRAGTVHVCDDVDDLSRYATQLATGQVPDNPYLVFGQQSITDETRSPAGTETAWAYTHVPRTVKSDPLGEVSGRWDDDDAEAFADRVEARVEALAPGFRSLIRGRHVFTPHDLEAFDANLSLGAVNGGTAQLHQQLIFRPVPGLARAGTPIKGLYLASASAHPGGGVHGASGANAARAALAAARRRALAGLR
ncbi:MAG: NAD(P)/FAD-dependent oxidoreductase [Actinobacteria bacterium]|nr:NAD(P)/FAD-dependent oxidoreductase [Actinomycetota bacterium]